MVLCVSTTQGGGWWGLHAGKGAAFRPTTLWPPQAAATVKADSLQSPGKLVCTPTKGSPDHWHCLGISKVLWHPPMYAPHPRQRNGTPYQLLTGNHWSCSYCLDIPSVGIHTSSASSSARSGTDSNAPRVPLVFSTYGTHKIYSVSISDTERCNIITSPIRASNQRPAPFGNEQLTN